MSSVDISCIFSYWNVDDVKDFLKFKETDFSLNDIEIEKLKLYYLMVDHFLNLLNKELLSSPLNINNESAKHISTFITQLNKNIWNKIFKPGYLFSRKTSPRTGDPSFTCYFENTMILPIEFKFRFDSEGFDEPPFPEI
ncbi:hypothetical protein RCL_jg11052.t1 [Rhizophagus clarus]|uniref:Uncharacterized protein n=1 Tax=Rhizophagus clarus TaxID=94130 RepID=A0A8H3M682_9GLOM|nr:hypothetical protein RCL_jg11052.t1 [Rhizophagus clarus]